MSGASHLTPDELAMLLEGFETPRTEVGSLLHGQLPPALLSLLQRSRRLTLEAEVADHRLRFPLSLEAHSEGELTPTLAAPAIEELGGDHPRPWRSQQKAILKAGPWRWAVYELSEQGLQVDVTYFTPKTGETFSATLELEGMDPLPLEGVWIRPTTEPGHWALHFALDPDKRQRLQGWLFRHHQRVFPGSGDNE